MKSFEINVERITGFRNAQPFRPIVILDERGKPFYDTSLLSRPVYAFNLPKGKYMVVTGKFFPRDTVVDYELFSLPPPERDKRMNPDRFEIKVGDNPNVCTIDWDDKTITYDAVTCERPLPDLMFILYHEHGHRYYKTEWKCDLYAANKMLETGYNPSQIGEAIVGSLSDKNYERQESLVTSLLNQDHFDNCDCAPDNFDFKSTPNTDWTCEDWVAWHRDLLKAYQDGRLGKYDYAKALSETNRVFAYWWGEAAGFSLRFWGECGYKSGFYNYFKSIGYTDHISFIAGLVTPLLGGTTEVAAGAGKVLESGGGIIENVGRNLFPMLLIGIIILILLR